MMGLEQFVVGLLVAAVLSAGVVEWENLFALHDQRHSQQK